MKNIFINHKKGAKLNIKERLTVFRVEPNVWDIFKEHHYLTQALNKSCKCFLFCLDGLPCGFIGLLNNPRKNSSNSLSISRIVVKPEFQGLGIGSIIIEFVCGIAQAEGYVTYIKTAHEKFGKYLEQSSCWSPTSYNGKIRKTTDYELGKYNNRLTRKSYCYKYVGKSINGFSELMLPINILRKNKKI